MRDLSVTAPIIQFNGSVNDFEADLRKAGINARLVCASQKERPTRSELLDLLKINL